MGKWVTIRLMILICILFTLLLIFDKGADADEMYLTGALGVFNSGKSSLSETKFANVGYRSPLGMFTQQVEIGGWIDRFGQGRADSAYTAYQVGWQVDAPLIARIMTGPCMITTPDVYLGGRLNFKEDLYVGEEDSQGRTIGIKYNHISSAGIYTPNIGRDALGVEIGIKF